MQTKTWCAVVACVVAATGCAGSAPPEGSHTAASPSKAAATPEWRLGKYSTGDGMLQMVIDRTGDAGKAKLQVAGSKDIVELTASEVRERGTMIGRDSELVLSATDRALSRRHCQFRLENGVLKLAVVSAGSGALGLCLGGVRRLPRALERLAGETLVVYGAHVLLLYGAHVGLRARIGPRLDLVSALALAAVILAASSALGLGWRRLGPWLRGRLRGTATPARGLDMAPDAG